MVNDPQPNNVLALKTQWQRIALVVVVLLALWESLRLFSSILMPFVVAAGLAYFLDPAVTRLERVGLRRPLGTFLLLVTVVTAAVLFVLLLYPVLAAQAAALVSNLPSYIKTDRKSVV